MEDDYFESDWDGEVYNNGVRCITEDGHDVAESEILDSNNHGITTGFWKKNPAGVWIKVEEEEECIA